MIGYREGVSEFPQNKDFSKFDFTSRTREISIGEVLIWMNDKGKFVATKITAITVKSRGDMCNNLSFFYKIYK